MRDFKINLGCGLARCFYQYLENVIKGKAFDYVFVRKIASFSEYKYSVRGRGKCRFHGFFKVLYSTCNDTHNCVYAVQNNVTL